jgi:hypothetical protein
MASIELWLFTVTGSADGRRRTTYRLTLEEARERYVDPSRSRVRSSGAR